MMDSAAPEAVTEALTVRLSRDSELRVAAFESKQHLLVSSGLVGNVWEARPPSIPSLRLERSFAFESKLLVS
jgi:hypothetical protein